MSQVFGKLGKKISDTFETAQKDIRLSVAKGLSVAATTIVAPPTPKAPGTKSKLFTTIFERSMNFRSTIIERRRTINSDHTPPPGITTTGANRDEVQDKLAMFARLEKEFCELLEAYEILLMERIHLEEIITDGNQIESLDDLELFSHYYKAIHDTAQISKAEVARLTNELSSSNGDRPITKDTGVAVEFSTISISPNEGSNTFDSSNLGETGSGGLEMEVSRLETLVKRLQSDNTELINQKKKLESRESELNSKVTILESQKIALETKLNYQNKQLQDHQALRNKVSELQSNNKEELTETKKELQDLNKKLQINEAEFSASKKVLDAYRMELKVLKENQNSTTKSLLTENQRLEASLKDYELLLEEERKHSLKISHDLDKNLRELAELQQFIGMKEKETLRHNVSISVESLNSASTSVCNPTDNESIKSPRKGSPFSASQEQSTIRAIQSECERLALENSRLKTHSNMEYLRNIVLKYLQLPDQRKALLPVLANILQLNPSEFASCRQ